MITASLKFLCGKFLFVESGNWCDQCVALNQLSVPGWDWWCGGLKMLWRASLSATVAFLIRPLGGTKVGNMQHLQIF